MRDEDDEDESDNESQERSFICESSVATKSKEKIKRCKKTVIFYNALNTKGKKKNKKR